jgi:hypothetical protein
MWLTFLRKEGKYLQSLISHEGVSLLVDLSLFTSKEELVFLFKFNILMVPNSLVPGIQSVIINLCINQSHFALRK